MLRLINQAKIALQVGQEARYDFAAFDIDIDLTAFRHLQVGIQRHHVGTCRRSVVDGQVPRVLQHLGVIEQLQFALHAQRELWHAKSLAEFRRRLEKLDGRGAADFGSFDDGGGSQFAGTDALKGVRLLLGQRRADGQPIQACGPS